MLTPVFKCDQDDTHIIITMKTPYIKAQEVEFSVNDNEFTFYCKPYFLRLTFSHDLKPEEAADEAAALGLEASSVEQTASYDVDKGELVARLPKANPGEHFENLDMLTQLMVTKKPGTVPGAQGPAGGGPPLIEVLSSTEIGDDGYMNSEDPDRPGHDWGVGVSSYADENIMVTGPKYGFNRMFTGFFRDHAELLGDVVEVPRPDDMTDADRRRERIDMEDAKFDPDYYIGDFLDPSDELKEVIGFKCRWTTELAVAAAGPAAAAAPARPMIVEVEAEGQVREKTVGPGEAAAEFTEEERLTLTRLPRREYLVDAGEERVLLLSLVDIVFSYAYDHRVCLGESTVESGWTISRISPTLSWLERFDSLEEVLSACLRRALAYPLYRNWKLAALCVRDTAEIFRTGPRGVLRCLLEARGCMERSDERYLLNKLYLDHYCTWLQSLSAEKIRAVAQELAVVRVTKAMVGAEWDLESIENEVSADTMEGDE